MLHCCRVVLMVCCPTLLQQQLRARLEALGVLVMKLYPTVGGTVSSP